MSRRCAFLTMERPEGFFIYDQLAVEPLRALGWTVEEIAWNRPDAVWSRYEVVVIRSTWDYQHDSRGFLQVLARIEEAGARLLNPLAICRWNMQKTYLRELHARGVPIVPTVWLERLESGALTGLFRELGTDMIVVKPVVGANADDTFPLHRGQASPELIRALETFADRPLMVQPFVKSIVETGEYSLFYFRGEYSHAILKTPCPGDFRVQEEHGGRIQSVVAHEDLRNAADRVIRAVGEDLLYARVDLARLPDGAPALVELELIEPSLYFANDDASPGRFAKALDEMMRRPAV